MKIRIENYEIVIFTVYSLKKKTQNPKKENSKFKTHIETNILI